MTKKVERFKEAKRKRVKAPECLMSLFQVKIGIKMVWTNLLPE